MGRSRFLYTFFAIPSHSNVLVILGSSGVPSDKRGGTPGVGSAYLRIGVLLQGNLIVESSPKVAPALPRRDWPSVKRATLYFSYVSD